jgi:hypothetical protein
MYGTGRKSRKDQRATRFLTRQPTATILMA